MKMTPGQRFKLICLGVYAVIVGSLTLCASLLVARGPHTVTINRIAKNQRISEADLRSLDFEKIRGKYAHRDFGVGDTIAPDDVGALQSIDSTNAFAVALVVPVARAAAGGELQVCLDGKAFGPPARIAASTCDERNCLVTIPISPWPKNAESITAKSRLESAAVGAACGGSAQAEPSVE